MGDEPIGPPRTAAGMHRATMHDLLEVDRAERMQRQKERHAESFSEADPGVCGPRLVEVQQVRLPPPDQPFQRRCLDPQVAFRKYRIEWMRNLADECGNGRPPAVVRD